MEQIEDNSKKEEIDDIIKMIRDLTECIEILSRRVEALEKNGNN